MNEPIVVESVTNECQLLGRAHESSSARAEQLIACLEGEVAKRDEELAACRVAVENCDVFRARIVELEADLAGTQSRVLVLQDQWRQLDAELAAIKLYASPVSEAKAQGVVQWPEADEIMQMAFEEGQPADDASGYCFELEEFDLFIERLMSEVARLNAAPAALAVDAGLASHLEFAVTLLTVAGLAGNEQVEAMRAALAANSAQGVV